MTSTTLSSRSPAPTERMNTAHVVFRLFHDGQGCSAQGLGAGWRLRDSRATVEGFVDVHSHAVPSGDDGAHSIEEAVELCGLALAGGTRVLFATLHAHAEWDHYPLTLERERLFEEAFPVVSRVVSAWGLDLRRGFEVFPTVLRDRDPHEYLGGDARRPPRVPRVLDR